VRLRKEETLLKPEVFGELVLRKDEILLELAEVMLRRDDILLGMEDFPDLSELMLLLPVSARFSPLNGLEMVVELTRLRLGEDVPNLKKEEEELVRLRFGDDCLVFQIEEFMRLRAGEDVPDLYPSSGREVRRSSFLCLFCFLRSLCS
jgi:hypothetical protein